MKNCVGQPVIGNDFFDREQEQRDFWRILEKDSVLLLAPRRIGKTSLMRRLEETATEHGFVAALDLSVADCTDELAFVQKLYEETLTLNGGAELIGKISKTASQILKRVENVNLPGGYSIEFSSGAKGQWRELATTLIRLLQEVEGKYLVSIDELPIFILNLLKDVSRKEAAKDFLNWFRELRQRTPHIRWLLAGSIGLDSITARLNMHDVINDLHPMDLGAFDSPTSHHFLLALAKEYGMDLTEEVRATVIERIGWTVPYYLQVVFSELLTLSDGGQIPIDIPMVETAFQKLLSPRRKSYFDYWRQRLHDELGEPDNKYSILLLNAICNDANGVSKDNLSQKLSNSILDVDAREEKLRYLLDVLESDGYLININGRYRFQILLLREFWQQRVAS